MMDDEVLLRRYLTGELAEDAAETLERRLLAEDELFEACDAIDDDLVAECVRGELPAGQRAFVLSRLSASPSGRLRLALTRSLIDIADGRTRTAGPPPPRSRPAKLWRWAALAAVLAIVLAAVWMLLRRSDLETAPQTAESPLPAPPRRESAPRATPPPRPTPPREDERIARRPGEAQAPVPVVFSLSLVVRRSASEVPRLTLPAEELPVEIRIDLDGSERFSAFWSLLRDGASGELRREDRLAVRPTDWGSMLVLELATADLPPGGYELEVQATLTGQAERQSLGKVAFEVVPPPAPS